MDIKITRTSDQYDKEIKCMNEIRAKKCVHCGKDTHLEIYKNSFKGNLSFVVSCWACGTRWEVDFNEEV